MASSTRNRSSAYLQHQHKVIGIYLELAQYPILARKIRERMRQELFDKRIITPEVFEAQVQERAITSQEREGMLDPFAEEPTVVWLERLALVRDQLTDFYFAYNVPHDRLEEIIHVVLTGRGAPTGHDMMLGFNPELSPWHLLFAKGEEFESLAPEKRAKIQHHLQEIIVVLIKGMISDQLELVGVAKELFSIQDLKDIWRRRIGRGKIGGKAAGMLLAYKILQLAHEQDEMDVHEHVSIPDSYFIGADVFYDFHAANDLSRYMNQKYKCPQDMEHDYPQIRAAFLDGRFPDDIVYSLEQLLQEV